MRSGALITSAEVDGVGTGSDWRRWIDNGQAPPSGDGIGFRSSYREDFQQLRQLGFEEVGLTLEWAALQPTAGRYDDNEVEHLRNVLDAAGQAGLEAWACLVDGTLPGWFAVDEHGFADDRSRNLLWPRHVEWIGETFGDLVSGWIPQREPIQTAIRAHLLAMGPPGQRDPSATARAVWASTLADGEAWRVLAGSSPVAMFHTARQFIPESDNVLAPPHAGFLDDLYLRSWLGALVDGEVVIDGLPNVATPQLRDAFDRIVLQLRPAVSIDGEGGWSPAPGDYLVEGLASALHRVADELPDRPLVVAADLAPVADDGTAQTDHLLALRAEAADAGAVGWWQTSPIDGWSWEQGFSRQAGVITADRSARSAAAVFGN